MVDTVVRKPETIYDKESDILRMQFEEKPSVRSVEVAEGVVLDYDEAGRVVAIEVDGASVVLCDLVKKAEAALSRPAR